MPESAATQFLPDNPEEASYLQEVFDALEFTHAIASPHQILTRLSAILQHGIDINFVHRLDTNEIQDKWTKWRNAIDLAISEYKTKNTSAVDEKDTVIYSDRPKNKAINLLFFGPKNPQSSTNSSNTLGLKLIFLASLMLPNEAMPKKNKVKIHHLFNLFIQKLRIFQQLNLNFTSDISFDTIIQQCENLVETRYTDPSKSNRQFLDSLKNSLRLLQGYHLGTPNKQPKPAPKAQKSPKGSSGTRVAKSIRHKPFYDPADYAPDIGTFIEIVPEQGEESIIGLIIPEAKNEDDNAISEELASAVTQVKTKYWLQTFHEATPWNSRGINPFTRSLLIQWIKDNDTVVSLIFGLMLSIGRRFEDILTLEIGIDSDITPDGTYIRSYIAPDNCFKPTPDQQLLVEPVTQTLRLLLPEIIKDRLIDRYTTQKKSIKLSELLEIKTEPLKKEAQEIIKQLIRTGATGLALDRIHLSLEKRLAEISGDEVVGYMLTGRQDNMPPVSAYYSTYPHSEVEKLYRKALEDLCRCLPNG